VHRLRFAGCCHSPAERLKGIPRGGISVSRIVDGPSRRWLARTKHLPRSDGNWSYSRPARADDPEQGWKLHISATILSAAEVFARAEPILRRKDALFKVPCRLELLRSLNSGLADFSQIGKFLTIYPRSNGEALELARELHRATHGLPGPRIPFDAQYRQKSLVYYRYGAFRRLVEDTPGFIRAPGGKRYRDKRAPGQAVPRWLEDPFQKSRQNHSKWRGLITHQLLAFKAKAQRGKGGVYEAMDLSVLPVRRVVIKEGRRHGETNWDGRDGHALIKHEARVLRELRKAGLPVPEIFQEFTKNGNRYLVLEQITGRPLLAVKRIQPANPSCRRAERILEQLGPMLSRMHAAGWTWRDCKPSHIFVWRGTVRFIDFEGACRIDQTGLLPWGSPDYTPPPNRGHFSRRAGTFEDDYALGVIAFQFLSGKFPPGSPRRRASIYKATRCPDSLRSRIESLLQV
jgi:Lipopolysaccharide kinase (Kdo/WaaP) family